LENAIQRPFRDHAGQISSSGSLMSGAKSSPLGSTVQMSTLDGSPPKLGVPNASFPLRPGNAASAESGISRPITSIAMATSPLPALLPLPHEASILAVAHHRTRFARAEWGFSSIR